jgi:hypothetical protein
MEGAVTYICKSEPHIAVVVILTMTSSGCSIFGFGTSLTLSLKGAWYSTAFIDMMVYLVRWAARCQTHIYAGKHGEIDDRLGVSPKSSDDYHQIASLCHLSGLPG